MKQLKNINHSFDLKLNQIGTTFRKGNKWHTIKGMVELWNCREPHHGKCTKDKGCRYEGIGNIIGSWNGKFVDVPSNLIDIEHNNNCQNAMTLIKTLHQAYGNFSIEDIFTVLIYERIEIYEDPYKNGV